MKLSNSVDEKLQEIGFIKVEEGDYLTRYQRKNEKYNYVQTLDLCHKSSGRHIAYSCDENLSDTKGIGNTCVGITMYEMSLCIKKMKQLGWKMKDGVKNND